MRLDELVDVNRIRTVNHTFDTSKLKKIGSGLFAEVFEGKGTNSIIKVASIHEDNPDAYVEFVRYIINHQDNPFFPKIYNAKLYDPKDHFRNQFVVEMEKLHPLDKKELIDVVPHLLNQIGIDSDDLIQSDIYTDQNPERAEMMLSERLEDFMSTPEGLQHLVTKADNPQFEQAAQVLIQLFEKYDADMHAGNVMVRLTGSGPQLVITDPVVYP